MVRAVKLEASASGTYWNASQGMFQTLTLGGSAPSVSLVSPLNGQIVTTPTGVPSSMTVSAVGFAGSSALAKMEFFANGLKIGESSVPTASGYAFNWTGVAEGSYAITARATDVSGQTTDSEPNWVSVRTLSVPVITATLTTGATQLAPATFSIIANTGVKTASDKIARVQLLANGTVVGEQKTTDLNYNGNTSGDAEYYGQSYPYSVTWSNAPIGDYTLTARAITAAGMSADSAPITVHVVAVAPPPSVSITSPAPGDIEYAGATVAVQVTAAPSVSNGSIAKVDLCVNGVKVATSMVAPFTLNWTPAAVGVVSLTAIATDGLGQSTTSSAVSVTVLSMAAGIRINCGGGSLSPFVADINFTGGTTVAYSFTPDLSAATNPAPASVYNSIRYGASFGYSLIGLTPNSSYKLRLHFCEVWAPSVGLRNFNVTANGAAVLANFDPGTAAGGAFKAVVKEFTVTADSNGRVTVAIASNRNAVDYNATLNGLEVLPVVQAPATLPAPGGLVAQGGERTGGFDLEPGERGGELQCVSRDDSGRGREHALQDGHYDGFLYRYRTDQWNDLLLQSQRTSILQAKGAKAAKSRQRPRLQPAQRSTRSIVAEAR